MGKYLSIGPDRGRCPSPPVQIWAWWFHALFLGSPYWEKLDGYMPAHMGGGVMEIFLPGLRYKA
jgi:hypothetical protein